MFSSHTFAIVMLQKTSGMLLSLQNYLSPSISIKDTGSEYGVNLCAHRTPKQSNFFYEIMVGQMIFKYVNYDESRYFKVYHDLISNFMVFITTMNLDLIKI